MIPNDDFDADEILRDPDERGGLFDDEVEEDTRELSFDTLHDENENYKEVMGDLGEDE